ncbi:MULTISPECIES: phosphodiester glycosidase family protein [Arthrobacter]|uniref:Phosphodiester glycosidase domain-containing protein n=1 Tax=Arthrobacter terricola TaxID=2547396 RepID=A0A4R5KHG0_9MICC|nr:MULTISPECIES: phosphodiester glycosidase family protein [Arthrobacter]MBT8159673.1 phosphodiester glycosidase family protein [Arthrobacter sp. GN70]TDF93700.1 hypothetical protein E1809_15430 [Arthrobacter terricola]
MASGTPWNLPPPKQRNPCTIADIDAPGRTPIVTADDRQTALPGLSIKEAADVARSLGMVSVINLDGGSTKMAQKQNRRWLSRDPSAGFSGSGC